MSNKDDIILVNDVIFYILGKVDESNVYMNCLRLCKNVYSFLTKDYEEKIKSFDLGIMGLHRHNPNLKWETDRFVFNKSIKYKHILLYPEIFPNEIQRKYRWITKEQIVKGETLFGTHKKYLNINHKDYLSLSTINNIILDNLNISLYNIFVLIRVFSNPKITFEDKILVPTLHIDNRLNNKTILELAKIKRIYTFKNDDIKKY